MIKFRLALVLSVFSIFTAANAASIVYSGDSVAGVSGLEFLDASYDAIFYNGSYDELLAEYPTPPNIASTVLTGRNSRSEWPGNPMKPYRA